MKRTKLIEQSGPYRAESCANGTVIVTPRWLLYNHQEIDGPGVLTRLELAKDIERLLNGEEPQKKTRKK